MCQSGRTTGVKLWNAVEHSEKRKDSQVAREVEVALPTELTPRPAARASPQLRP